MVQFWRRRKWKYEKIMATLADNVKFLLQVTWAKKKYMVPFLLLFIICHLLNLIHNLSYFLFYLVIILLSCQNYFVLQNCSIGCTNKKSLSLRILTKIMVFYRILTKIIVFYRTMGRHLLTVVSLYLQLYNLILTTRSPGWGRRVPSPSWKNTAPCGSCWHDTPPYTGGQDRRGAPGSCG